MSRFFENCNDYESDFSRSYVHDEEGYDDDTIHDAFDGDPEAYWNID